MHKRNHRLIRATVAAGSLLAVVVMGFRLTDEYLCQCRDQQQLSELEATLTATRTRDDRLKRIEVKLQEEYDRLVNRSTTPDQIQSVRDEVLHLVRLSGAKLRSLDVSEGQNRRWATSGDDPQSTQLPDWDMESDFVLHSHTLTLVADGSLSSVLDMAKRVRDHHWLMTVDSLEMKPQAEDGSIGVELQWTLYGLDRSERPLEDDMDEELAN